MVSRNQLPSEFQRLAEAFSAQQCYVLFSDITLETADEVYEDTREWKKAEPVERLLLVLDSAGGDISAAYQIIKVLHSVAKELVVAVPRWAKSAATLICLGASELVMTEIAELGPIDPQIRKPSEVEMHPALDDFSSLAALRTETAMNIDVIMPTLIHGTGMNIDTLLPATLKFVADLMKPVYAQVSPQMHASHKRTLKISEEYAVRVLSRWGVIRDATLRDRIAYDLCFGYPSHDFVIDYRELSELKFPVRLPRDEEERVLSSLVRFSQRLNFMGWLSPPQHVAQEVALAQQEAAVGAGGAESEGSAGVDVGDADFVANVGEDPEQTGSSQCPGESRSAGQDV